MSKNLVQSLGRDLNPRDSFRQERREAQQSGAAKLVLRTARREWKKGERH
jgi:hypothetical protein